MGQFAGPIDVHGKVVELIDSGGILAVATVLLTHGSTPQCAGAKFAMDVAGRLWGTIGGGAVEAEARRLAMEAYESRRPIVFDFELDNNDAAQSGAICGGMMRMLVDPTVAQHRSSFAGAAEALTCRQRGILLTTISNSDQTAPPVTVQIEWLSEGDIPRRVGFPDARAIESCLQRLRPQRFLETLPTQRSAVEVLVEPVISRPLLLIAGGGHVGQALAVGAVQVGFDVTVVDDRAEFTDPALFPPGVTTCCGPVPEQLGSRPLDADTFVVIVTRGHRHDADALAACIRKRPAYIGMIGSRRKVALLRQTFLDKQLATPEDFDRVFAPIGLSIGALTVPEIAVSIVAQLIAVRRKSAAGPTTDARMIP